MNSPSNNTDLPDFSQRILTWFAVHGRHDLPWQQHLLAMPNPYPVWISEVMLQQTQVTTVIPYFTRFMQSFPTVQDLANADWEQVAEHWAGLGYYARARNLHKGAKQLAQIIADTGDFPQTVQDWQAIAGVGQSTAGAIVAMGVRATQEKGVICDGNVKRVLTRWAGIDADINKTATTKTLWALAERLTPATDSGLYAQAMMDMGATVCTKSKPNCLFCPIEQDCVAKSQGRQTDYPVKSKKSPNPSKYSLAIFLTDNDGKTLWLQRPDNGIWGGLYCLPLFFVKKNKQNQVVADFHSDFDNEYTLAEQVIFEFLSKHSHINSHDFAKYFGEKMIKHSLTHFHWFLTPITIVINDEQKKALNERLNDLALAENWTWIGQNDVQNLAISTAMQKLM